MKLKPCPFCGVDAVGPENWNKEAPTKDPEWVIHCKHWCISMKRGTKKEVTENWNKRTEKQ